MLRAKSGRWAMNFDDLFGGYVELVLYVSQGEDFINKATKQGIMFANVYRKNEKELLVKIKLEDFKTLTRLLRKQHLKFHILSRFGLPFWISRMKRRKGLLLGVCFSSILLAFLLSLIWGYEVSGNEKFSDEYIIALVQQYGLVPGSAIDSFDYAAIQKQIVLEHKDFSWIAIKPRGTTLEIKVKERLNNKIDDATPADLVAKTDGKITELLVYKGTAAVKLEEKVRKGQILIGGWDYGEWSRNDLGKYVPAGDIYLVQAKGIIRGEVAHSAVGICFLEENILFDTGETSKTLAIKTKNKHLVLLGEMKNPYLHSRKENYTKNIIFWQKYQLPWQIEETTYIEQELQQVKHSREEAYHLALERAREKLTSLLSEQRIFLEETIRLLPSTDENQIQVEVTWLTEENMGLLKFAEGKEKDSALS